MAKINVEEVASLLVNHDIVRVTITQAKYIGCDTVPCSGPYESIPGLLKSLLPLILVVFLHVFSHELFNSVVREGLEHRLMVLYIRDSVTVLHEFKVALFTVRTQHLVGRHRQVQVVREPHLIHDVNDLQGENVLPKVVSIFEKELQLFTARLLVQTPETQGNFLRTKDCAEVIPEISDDYLRINRKSEKKWKFFSLST